MTAEKRRTVEGASNPYARKRVQRSTRTRKKGGEERVDSVDMVDGGDNLECAGALQTAALQMEDTTVELRDSGSQASTNAPLLCTPPDVLLCADATLEKLMPDKSQARYRQEFEKFREWCATHSVPAGYYSENVLLAYVEEISRKYSAGSMWSKFSMLRSSILTLGGKDLGELPRIVKFVKKISKAHSAKKSLTFTRDQINEFMRDAPDEANLPVKVATVFGLFGACRKGELANLLLSDVTDSVNHLLVRITEGKTGARSFAVLPDGLAINGVELYRRYVSLRPVDAPPRLFLCFRGGKVVRQPIGINTIGLFPKKIAEFLRLDEPQLYTGHALRRSAATWLGNSGVDLISLKRFGGWHSDQAPLGYIAESTHSKLLLASRLACVETPTTKVISASETNKSPEAVLEGASITIENSPNCTFNINIQK